PSFHYSVTKAAMNAMTHYMAGSVGQFNIRVNAIAPGPTMTEATKKGVPQDYLDLIINMQMAIHRPLDPSDLTGTAVWLASEDSTFVTGQVFCVDGGMIMLGCPSARRAVCGSWSCAAARGALAEATRREAHFA